MNPPSPISDSPSSANAVRTLHPEVRIADEKTGLAEYIASDETVDNDREIIVAAGWRFNRFKKNAPFVDSHDYSSIDKQLGKVITAEVKGGRLIEQVQWAIEVTENPLIQIGWKMTVNGYLKAVSVGFDRVSVATRKHNPGEFRHQLAQRGMDMRSPVEVITLEQEQTELSACVLGVNPNAVARAYKSEVVNDSDIDYFLRQFKRDPAALAPPGATAKAAHWHQRKSFLDRLPKPTSPTETKTISSAQKAWLAQFEQTVKSL